MIILAAVLVYGILLDMVQNSIKINNFFNSTSQSFKIEENEFPYTLIYGLFNGYYESKNSDYLKDIINSFKKYSDEELKLFSYELHLHQRNNVYKKNNIKLILSILGSLTLLQSFIEYKISVELSSGIGTIGGMMIIIFTLIYYLQTENKRELFFAFLDELISEEILDRQGK